MQQEYFYRFGLQPSTDRRLSPRQKHRMWVVHGCVPLRGSNLLALSLQRLPPRPSKQSAAAHKVERVDGESKAASPDFLDGDHHAHKHVFIFRMGGAHNDRSGWPTNRHYQ